MKRPGLTPAMRRALERVQQRRSTLISATMRNKLIEANMIELRSPPDIGWKPTPRGHAALAAEPMTQGEYEAMVLFDRGDRGYHWSPRLAKRGWIAYVNGAPNFTDAGRTALNNMRAAEGSAEWKEDLK